jgi:hypothetical protein
LQQERNTAPYHLSTEEFQALKAGSPDTTDQRRTQFFKERAEIVARHYHPWIALHRTYQPLWQTLAAGTRPPLILTNKNRVATREIAQYFKLPVGDEHLFTGDNGVSKTENFRQLMTRYPSKRYAFLEDSLHNLDEIRENLPDAPIELCLVRWGYIDPSDITQAQQSGYTVLNQEEAIALWNSPEHR